MTSVDATTERFVRAIRTALVGPPELSQRDLCGLLGITIGSLSKYLRGEVKPDKVGFGVQCKLAGVMGHTVDTLQRYYSTGQWTSETHLEDVVGWIRSDAGAADLPAILESMSAMTARTAGASSSANTDNTEDYLWPLQEIRQANITDDRRQKLGLTDEALWKLAKEGTFDDDLVWAFSMACDYEEEAVREAFTKKAAVV